MGNKQSGQAGHHLGPPGSGSKKKKKGGGKGGSGRTSREGSNSVHIYFNGFVEEVDLKTMPSPESVTPSSTSPRATQERKEHKQKKQEESPTKLAPTQLFVAEGLHAVSAQQQQQQPTSQPRKPKIKASSAAKSSSQAKKAVENESLRQQKQDVLENHRLRAAEIHAIDEELKEIARQRNRKNYKRAKKEREKEKAKAKAAKAKSKAKVKTSKKSKKRRKGTKTKTKSKARTSAARDRAHNDSDGSESGDSDADAQVVPGTDIPSSALTLKGLGRERADSLYLHGLLSRWRLECLRPDATLEDLLNVLKDKDGAAIQQVLQMYKPKGHSRAKMTDDNTVLFIEDVDQDKEDQEPSVSVSLVSGENTITPSPPPWHSVTQQQTTDEEHGRKDEIPLFDPETGGDDIRLYSEKDYKKIHDLLYGDEDDDDDDEEEEEEEEEQEEEEEEENNDEHENARKLLQGLVAKKSSSNKRNTKSKRKKTTKKANERQNDNDDFDRPVLVHSSKSAPALYNQYQAGSGAKTIKSRTKSSSGRGKKSKMQQQQQQQQQQRQRQRKQQRRSSVIMSSQNVPFRERRRSSVASVTELKNVEVDEEALNASDLSRRLNLNVVDLEYDTRCLCKVGKHLWVASRDGCIHIRTMKTGDLVRKVRAQHIGSSRAKNFHVNVIHRVGRRVWCGDSQGVLRGFNWNGKLLFENFDHKGSIRAIRSVSKPYSVVYSSAEDWTILSHNAMTGETLMKFVGHCGFVRALVHAPIRAQGPDKHIQRSISQPLLSSSGSLHMSNEHTLWSGANDGVRVWSSDGDCLALLNPKSGVSERLNLRWARGKRSKGHRNMKSKALKPQNVHQNTTLDSTVYTLTVVNGHVWCGLHSGKICVWDSQSFELVTRFQAHKKAVQTIVKVFGVEVWTCASGARAIKMWDASTFKPLGRAKWDKDAGIVSDAIFSSKSNSVWLGCRNHSCLVKVTIAEEDDDE